VTRVLVVDGANVVGATPDGWWKDRAGAARRLHERLLVADTAYDEVVLVVEGKAKGGVKPGRDLHVTTIHARRDGDSAVIGVVNEARERDEQVTVVTADRVLRGAVEHLGAQAMSPSWLLDQI
jgi:predicted RNA-binding protein with PIN domain